MFKTLRISFTLRITYKINSILYSLKQIPGIKKLLPVSLYKESGLKVFVTVLALFWEMISAFLGKFIYFLIMVFGVSLLMNSEREGQVFLHILFFLSVVGAFLNTYMFEPGKDKYYAMILMRMNAKQYALINYGYEILKVIMGFAVFGILFGILSGLSWWKCVLIPFFVAGIKTTVVSMKLWRYEKIGNVTSENRLDKFKWIAIFALLIVAYALPAVGYPLPEQLLIVFMSFFCLTGMLSIRKMITFGDYRKIYQIILCESMTVMNEGNNIEMEQTRNIISTDTKIVSSKKGFEYLNELFIKRHQKILWKSEKRLTGGCLGVVVLLLLIALFFPETKTHMNQVPLTFLPYFTFIMYMLNRGTGFTKALFMNCDHSLLTYSFYKQPKHVLHLFQIRLREIIKINLPVAIVIGGGLAVVLYVSGGTDNPWNYAVLIVSILCMSIFFSVHYLTLYYLLQPYNAATEIKSGVYQLFMSGTYMVCYFMMQVKLPTMAFGGACILFCAAYCVIASILVYKFAPKTFKLRN